MSARDGWNKSIACVVGGGAMQAGRGTGSPGDKWRAPRGELRSCCVWRCGRKTGRKNEGCR